MNQDGSLTYTPNPNFHGSDLLLYQIQDADGDTAVADVVLIVNPVNDGPVAVDDVYLINEDQTLTVPSEGGLLVNDSVGGDGGLLQVVDFTQPVSGTLIVTPNGEVIYMPEPNFNGSVEFEYTLQDGDGTTATARVSIAVNSVNDVPKLDSALVPGQFDPDSGFVWSIDDGESINRDIGSAFSDEDGDPLLFTAEGLPPGLTLDPDTGILSGVVDNSASRGGENNDGLYVVVITVSDQNGGLVEWVITIVVGNPVPEANQDVYFLDEDTVLNVSASGVLENDTDPDGDALQVTAVVLPPSNGVAVLNPDGSLTYTPNPNFNGSDLLLYQIEDADGDTAVAAVILIINPIDDGPVAVDDVYVVNEDQVLTVPDVSGLLSNDSVGGDGGLLTVVDNTSIGNGVLIVTASGELIYIPALNFNGTEVFEYTIQDADGTIDTATVTLIVNEVNDPPMLQAGRLPSELGDGPVFQWKVLDGESLNLDLGGGFDDADQDGLRFIAEGLPPGLSIHPETGVISGIVPIVASSGGDGNDGVYVVVVTVTDQRGGTTELELELVVGNPLPSAVDDSYTIDEDTLLNIPAPGVLANDTDPDGDVLRVTGIVLPASNGEATLNPDGSLTYLPNPEFNGSDFLIYQMEDSDGGTSAAVVSITVIPANDPPLLDLSLLPEEFQTEPVLTVILEDNQNVSIDLGGAFRDQELDNLSFLVDNLPPGLRIDPETGLISGTIPPSGSQGGTNEDVIYQIIISVSDGKGGITPVDVQIRVLNPPPVAVDDAYSVSEESVLVVDAPGVLVNDSDPDGDGISVSGLLVQPSGGEATINSDGSLIYTPNGDFHGLDQFVYELIDTNGGTSSAFISVDVIDIKDPPVANPDSYVLGEDVSETFFDIKVNDYDPDSTELTPVIVDAPPGGSIRIDAVGDLYYTPNDDFSGTDIFTYKLVDEANQESAPAEVRVRVLAGPKNHLQSPDAPIVIFQNVEGFGTTLTFSADNNPPNQISVTDPDSEELTITMSVTNGNLSVDANPNLVFTDGVFEDSRGIQMFGRKEHLNEALASLRYVPDLDYLGPDRLVIFTEDEGGPGELPVRFDEDNDGLTILVELRALAGLQSSDVSSLLSHSAVPIKNVELVGFDDKVIGGVTISTENGLDVAFDPLPGQGGLKQPTEIEILVTYEDGSTDTLKIPVTVFQPELIVVEELEPTISTSSNLNPQTGFFEQVIEIANNTPFDFAAIRIYIHDMQPDVNVKFMTKKDLFGTYVEFAVDLKEGESTTVILEYFSTTGKAITPPRLEMLVRRSIESDPTGPTGERLEAAFSAGVGANGRVNRSYLSFHSEEGFVYWVEYSDDMVNWKAALNSIEGTGEMILWQDTGAPNTAPMPSGNGQGRIYRIVKQPVE
ncbi:MAG: tandem-95 repeat protein [Verrucomicrobia bacterium]|nr:tandem-95 repeat protein [Verrucomicrobiota bacterium]